MFLIDSTCLQDSSFVCCGNIYVLCVILLTYAYINCPLWSSKLNVSPSHSDFEKFDVFYRFVYTIRIHHTANVSICVIVLNLSDLVARLVRASYLSFCPSPLPPDTFFRHHVLCTRVRCLTMYPSPPCKPWRRAE